MYPKHLYIHWPFCTFKCHYCDFVAFEQHAQFQESYHKVLLQEIDAFAIQNDQAKSTPINTIFIGGGTPSLYHLPWITELFATLNQKFNLTTTTEITIETNPADIDEERLETWREIGINRLSVGVQSLNDDVLLKLNRRQRASDVQRVMRIAPKYFDNISVDMILGLPDITSDEWFATLKQIVTWPIKHISVYFLTIHEKTPLYFKVQRGDTKLIDDEAMVTLYEKTVNLLEQSGFEQYEISNFAKQGYQSTHNQAYWDRKPYKGFGVGAASFDGQMRITNDNNLSRYLDAEARPTIQEKLTRQQEIIELLMLGLRQKKGLDLHHMVYFLNESEKKQFEHNVSTMAQAELIEKAGENIRLTLKGMALENEVIVRLL